MQKSTSGFLKLVSSSAAGQVLLLLITPILTRVYSPHAFGVFSSLISITSILVPVAALRFESAIPVARGHGEAGALTRLALITSTAFVCCLVPLSILGTKISGHSAVLGVNLEWFWLLVPLLLATSWFAIFSQVAVRAQAYGSIANRTLWQSGGTAGGQLLMPVLIGNGPGGLILGQVLGRLFGISRLARVDTRWTRKVDRATYLGLLRRYWRFPCIFSPSALLNALGSMIPLLFFMSYYGASVAGQFGLAQRMIAAPVALIGTAYGQIYAGDLSNALRQGDRDARRNYLRSTRRLVIIGAATSVLVYLMSDSMFAIVFGEQWKLAGSLAVALSMLATTQLVSSPLSFVFIAYERVGWNVALDLFRVALLACALTLSVVWSLGPVKSAWLISCSLSIIYVTTWVVGLSVVTDHDRNA